MSGALLAEALAHAACGRLVVPCHTVRAGRCTCGRARCPWAGKHPRTEHGVKDATTDAVRIRAWWERWPDANLALRTGEHSGVDVFDVDPKHGGRDALERLEALHGLVPATWRARSGSGGDHYYFVHYPGLRCSTGRVGGGLDVRADDGYALLPPSRHASGGHYAWIVVPDGGSPASWPEWLLLLALPRVGRGAPVATVAVAGPLPVPPALLRYAEQGAGEGRRNSLGFWLACRLVEECGAGGDAAAVLERFGHACRPPLEEAELDRIWENAQRAETFNPRTPVYRSIHLATGERLIQRDGLRVQSTSGGALRTTGIAR